VALMCGLVRRFSLVFMDGVLVILDPKTKLNQLDDFVSSDVLLLANFMF